jgi:hypothetical protein
LTAVEAPKCVIAQVSVIALFCLYGLSIEEEQRSLTVLVVAIIIFDIFES